MSTNRAGTIPSTQGVSDQQLRRVLDSLKTNVEIMRGHTGGALRRAVTLQDLVDLGLITQAQAQTQALKQP
jgi:hypothetical protein